MEPRQELLITKHSASPCPRASFWFFVLSVWKWPAQFPPLSPGFFQPGHRRLRRVRRDSQKDKKCDKSNSKRGTGRAYQCPGDEQGKVPLTDLRFVFFRACYPWAGDHRQIHKPPQSHRIYPPKYRFSAPQITLSDSQDKGPGSAFLARFPGDVFISSFKFEDHCPRVSEQSLRVEALKGYDLFRVWRKSVVCTFSNWF